jgi:hypothetical protein
MSATGAGALDAPLRELAPARAINHARKAFGASTSRRTLTPLVAELREASFEVAVAQYVLAPLAFDGSTFLLSEVPACPNGCRAPASRTAVFVKTGSGQTLGKLKQRFLIRTMTNANGQYHDCIE